MAIMTCNLNMFDLWVCIIQLFEKVLNNQHVIKKLPASHIIVYHPSLNIATTAGKKRNLFPAKFYLEYKFVLDCHEWLKRIVLQEGKMEKIHFGRAETDIFWSQALHSQNA